MHLKYLSCTLLLTVLLFVSCKNKDGYTIEGSVKNLSNPSLYIVTTNDSILNVDTIQIDKSGKFTFHSSSDSLKPVIIYMESGTVWTTIWAKNNEKIILSGDVRYPELILAKGGEVNDLITGFKVKNKELIRDRWELQVKQTSSKERTDSLQSTEHEGVEYSSKIININQQLQHEVEDFVKAHPSSVASLILIQDYLIDSEDPERIQEYLSLIKGEAVENQLYLKLQKRTKQILQTHEGYQAPDFSIIDTKNDTINLNTFKNKYLLLTFAASWCEMCKAENQALIKLRQMYNKEQLGMLTISLDEDSAGWEKIASEENITWYQVIDNRGWGSDMVSRYNITAVPTNILIDKENKIIARSLSADSLTILLKDYLK